MGGAGGDMTGGGGAGGNGDDSCLPGSYDLDYPITGSFFPGDLAISGTITLPEPVPDGTPLVLVIDGRTFGGQHTENARIEAQGGMDGDFTFRVSGFDLSSMAVGLVVLKSGSFFLDIGDFVGYYGGQAEQVIYSVPGAINNPRVSLDGCTSGFDFEVVACASPSLDQQLSCDTAAPD